MFKKKIGFFLQNNFLFQRKKMSKVFKSKRNPVTGEAEWSVEGDDYDFYQEIARSGYADMLHDHERNVLYYRALKSVIEKLKLGQTSVHVVDIGTGTGLLSMMAAKVGADRVTAIEAFEPIAITARKIIDLNGYSDKINVISKRSTDISESEMPEKADVAVAEVFDTELIGEGALRTFAEAHKFLLKNPCRVIPSKATVYVQIIQSDEALKWEKIFAVKLPEFNVDISVPPDCASCHGNASVHDVQLNHFPQDTFVFLTEPTPIFTFDFECSENLKFDESHTSMLSLINPDSSDTHRRADGLIFWWDLDMDGTGQLILSMKPNWAKNPFVQWRDHWMQAIYYFSNPLNITDQKEIALHSFHDEYSFWFSATDSPSLPEKSLCQRPVCTCGLHIMFSRRNVARFNEMERYRQFCKSFSSVLRGKRCLSIGDCNMLSIIALKLGASKVFALEKDDLASKSIESYANANNIDTSRDLIVIDDISQLPLAENSFDVVFSDFFYISSTLPWHNLHFWYTVDQLVESGTLPIDYRIYPDKAVLYALPVNFDDLHKIRSPIDHVEGFDITPFDNIVQGAIKNCDARIEPQPLWEYSSTALAEPEILLEFDLTKRRPKEAMSSTVKISLADKKLPCNGLVFYMDWFYANSLVNGSLKNSVSNGVRPVWDMCQRQAVYFVQKREENGSSLTIESNFNPKDEEVVFYFSFE